MFQITAVVGAVVVRDKALVVIVALRAVMVVVVVLGERKNGHKTLGTLMRRTIFSATTLTRLVWCHRKSTWG